MFLGSLGTLSPRRRGGSGGSPNARCASALLPAPVSRSRSHSRNNRGHSRNRDHSRRGTDHNRAAGSNPAAARHNPAAVRHNPERRPAGNCAWGRRSALSEAGRDHIAVLSLPRDLTPLAAATADIDRGAGRDLGDNGVGRAGSLPEIDSSDDNRGRRRAGLRRARLRRARLWWARLSGTRLRWAALRRAGWWGPPCAAAKCAVTTISAAAPTAICVNFMTNPLCSKRSILDLSR